MTPEILSKVMRSLEGDIKVAVPCRVVRFDPNTAKAVLEPMVKEPIQSRDADGEGGFTYQEMPYLYDVPICFFQGTGIAISFRLNPGDSVFAILSALDWGNWFQTGEKSETEDHRRHTLDNAFAYPAGFHQGQTPPVPAANTLALVAPNISMGAVAATEPLGMASLIEQKLAEFMGLYRLHTHLDPMSGSTGVPSNAGTVVDPPAGSLGSSHMKGIL